MLKKFGIYFSPFFFREKRNLPLDFFVVVNLSRSFSHLPWHCLLGKSFLKCPLGIFVFTYRYACSLRQTYIHMYKYYRHCIFLCFFNHFKMGLWEIKLYTEDKTRMKKGNKEWAEINCLKNIQRDKMTYLVLDSIIYCRLFLHHYNSMKNHEVHVY